VPQASPRQATLIKPKDFRNVFCDNKPTPRASLFLLVVLVAVPVCPGVLFRAFLAVAVTWYSGNAKIQILEIYDGPGKIFDDLPSSS
jgi:hypothetical protein